MDDLGNPKKIVADNGVVFYITNMKEGAFDLLVQSYDGLEYAYYASENSSSKEISAKQGAINFSTIATKEDNFVSNDSKVQVNVGCKNLNGKVVLDVKDNTGKLLRKFFPKHEGDGVYSVNIPNGLAPSVDPAKVCNSLNNLLKPICRLYRIGGASAVPLGDAICIMTSGALALTVVGAPVAAAFGVACRSVNLGLGIYCKYTTASFSPLDPYCELAENFYFEGDINLEAYVTGITIGGPLPSSNRELVKGSGPYPTLNINNMPDVLNCSNCDYGSIVEVGSYPFYLFVDGGEGGVDGTITGTAFLKADGTYVLNWTESIYGNTGTEQATWRIGYDPERGCVIYLADLFRGYGTIYIDELP